MSNESDAILADQIDKAIKANELQINTDLKECTPESHKQVVKSLQALQQGMSVLLLIQQSKAKDKTDENSLLSLLDSSTNAGKITHGSSILGVIGMVCYLVLKAHGLTP